MPLSKLRCLRDELEALISRFENGLPREIDIAMAHTGAPALIAQVLRVWDEETNSKWIQAERIFCSLEKCPNCPHGDFMYEYKRNKKLGTISVRYKGPFEGFPQEDLDKVGFYRVEGDKVILLKSPKS